MVDNRQSLDRILTVPDIDRVLREKTPVLANADSDAAAGEDPVTAAICVPLMVFERLRGALYLDSTDPMARFEPEQLEWLSAIGGIAALVMDNLRRIEWLEGENRRLRAGIAIEAFASGLEPDRQLSGSPAAPVASRVKSG